MKRKTPLIILLSVLVILAAGYLVLRYYNDQQTAEEASINTQITLAQLDEVESFSYTYQDVQSTFQKNDDGQWYCVEDENLELDQTVLEQMVVELQKITAEQMVTDDLEKAGEYGLDVPQCSITATGVDGTTYTVLIGNHLDFNDTYYVQMEGNAAIYSVSYGLGDYFCIARDQLAETEE